MKANEAPERLYLSKNIYSTYIYQIPDPDDDTAIEYTRTDTFIEKARKWFEIQNEGVDSDGNYNCDMADFEDFRNYIEK